MAAIEIPIYLLDRATLVGLGDGVPPSRPEAEASLARLREAGFIDHNNALTPKGEAALPHCRRKRDTCPFTGKAR